MRLTVFFTILILVCGAHAEVLVAPASGRYSVDGNFSYFSSSANYPSGGGSSSALLNGNSFTQMREELNAGYDLNSQIELYAGTSGSQVQADDNSQTQNNSGFDEVRAGGRYWLSLEWFDLVPQFDLVYPLFRVDTGSSDPLVGEGAMNIRASTWVIRRFGQFQAFGYLGFEYRDEGRSDLMPFAVGGQFQPGSLWFNLQLRGFESLTNDSNVGSQSVRDVYLNLADAGSYRFYGINPNLMEAALEAGLHYGDWDPYVGFAQTLTGSSTASGWTGLIGVKYSPQPVVLPSERDRFSEPAENYNQSVFQKANPTVRPRSRQQFRRRSPPPQPSNKSVNDLLNQTEKELENRGQ